VAGDWDGNGSDSVGVVRGTGGSRLEVLETIVARSYAAVTAGTYTNGPAKAA
jgi:hypothetical protein